MNRWLHLSGEQVAQVNLPVPEIRAAVEEMFLNKAAGRVEMPPKLGVSLGADGFLHAMPCSIPCVPAVGMKWIGALPSNPSRGAPQISGVILLNDPENGLPIAVLDAAWITAKRTAAASVVAVSRLAWQPVHTLAVLGCGNQGRSHVEAFVSAFPIRKVLAYDVSKPAALSFLEQMEALHGSREDPRITFSLAEQPKEAVGDADIVVTAGPIAKKPYETIQAGWLRHGACGVSIDFASAWSSGAIAGLGTVCVDDLPQFRTYQQIGYFAHVPRVDVALEHLVSGEHGREPTGQGGGFACMLGLASEDLVVAERVFQRAKTLGIGTWIDR